MIKKFLTLTLCLLTVTLLSSCLINTIPPEGNEQTSIKIVTSTPKLAGVIAVAEAIERVYPMAPTVVSDTSEKTECEVVIGNTSRNISKEAYTRLANLRKENDGHARYVVYSDGSSVAIAYEEDRYGLFAALSKSAGILAKMITDRGEIKFDVGVVASGSFDVLDYQQTVDDAKQAEQWKIYEEYINSKGGDGEKIVAAIKFYYEAVCTDDLIPWFAELYEPNICICNGVCQGTQYCGGGGYYYSVSARNTLGFLPDAESTQQALNFWITSGLADSNGGSLVGTIPEWMRKQIIVFLKGLQDPDNGFFYHPQWTRDEVDSNVNHRARALSRAVSALAALGSAPTYDTPTGIKGDGIIPTSHLVSPLGSSAVAAASKAVQAAGASSVPSYLVDDTSFREYLDEFVRLNSLPADDSKHRSFYSIGNEIANQTAQIVSRDAKLAAAGATYSLCDILLEWLGEHQNKKTGLWDEGVGYDNTNALLKIVVIYHDLEADFPNPDLAIESCITMLTSTDEVSSAVYVYNVWLSLDRLISNLRRYSSFPSALEFADEVEARLLESAAETIRISAEKQLTFKKDDGSFSFTPTYSQWTSQGVRVAVPYSEEGDVNATTICTSGTIGNCLAAIGISSYVPSYFTETDRLRYITMLEELEPIVKNEADTEVYYEEFEDYEIGSEPEGSFTHSCLNGSFTVVDDPKGGGNSVAEFSTVKGDYETVKMVNQWGALTSTCFVFESDLNVVSSDEGVSIQIRMQPSVYMLELKVQDGRVHIRDSSSTTPSNARETNLNASAALGEWFNVKVEYFIGDHDTVRIRVYFNDELIAVTDNYFDADGTKLTERGTPSKNFEYMTIVGKTNFSATLLMDNVAAYKTSEAYNKPEAGTTMPGINVDPPDKEEIKYTFDDGEIPEEFTVSSGQNTVEATTVDGSDGVWLKLNGAASISLPINVRTSGAECLVLDSNVIVDMVKNGTAARIYYRENNSENAPVISFDLTVKDGFVTITESPDGNPAATLDGVAVPVGEKFNLRLEYYERELVTVIYVDGVPIAISNAICKSANKYSAGKLEIVGLSDGTTDIYIDDVVFERSRKSFTEASAPDSEEKKHDFESSDPDISLSGGATVSSGVARLPENARMVIGVNDRNRVVTATLFRAKLSAYGTYATYVFTLTDDSDTPVFAFALDYRDNAVSLVEYYAGGRGATVSRTPVGEEFTLSFKYFHSDGLLCVYIDNACVGVLSLGYLYENEGLVPAYVEVANIGGNADLTVDDCIAENNVAVYKKEKVSNVVTDNGSPDLTFEKSFGDSWSERLSVILSTTGAQAGVKGLRLPDGTFSKLLALKTAAGGNDYVDFKITDSEKHANAKVTVFEAEIYLDSDSYCTNFKTEFYLRDSSGNKAWIISLTANEGGDLIINDWYSSGGYLLTAVGEECELLKIRFEYMLADDAPEKMLVNVFVNDKYVGTSYRSYAFSKNLASAPDPSVPSDITVARILTTSAASGSVLIDNVEFYQTNTATDVPNDGDGSMTGWNADAAVFICEWGEY